MKFCSVVVLLSLLCLHQLVGIADSKNILLYFAISGYSHINSIWPLVERLVSNGHHITLLCSIQPNQKPLENVTIIDSEETYGQFAVEWEEHADLVQERIAGRHFKVLDPFFEISYKTCETVLRSTQPEIYNLVHKTKFDLVIIDEDANLCGMAIAHYKYKSPFMFYSAFTFFNFMYDEYGVPLDSAIPDTEYGREMTYIERFRATMLTLKWTYYFHRITYEPMGKLVQEVFSLQETPTIPDLYNHTSLVLINNHPSTDYPRSLPPLFVSVGGMHIEAHQLRPRKHLPKELNQFISKPGSEGFMYISFGTSVRISKSNHEIREKFFNAMGNMSHIQFVWKWEGEIPQNGPPNVYFANWLPQQDLYAHPRIKGAIYHMGINGMHEAVYYGVPLIMFPICYDQNFNAYSVASKGMGVLMEIATFSELELRKAIEEILTNSTMRDNISRASKQFKDRPMPATDTALWWVEYVIRHKGKTGLVPPGKWQTWYQRRFLDIWFPIFVVLSVLLFVILALLYKIIQFLIGLFRSESKPQLNGTKKSDKKLN